jgi:hypothetical protein
MAEELTRRRSFFPGLIGVDSYYDGKSLRFPDKDLDCGGTERSGDTAFGCSDLCHAKAAWRFASRRTPKAVVVALAASGPFMV